MKVQACLAMALLAVSSTVFATAQMPDKMIVDGQEYRLHTNPMEPYFELHPEKKPASVVISTGLWRGYVATFEIKEDNLVLKDIEALVPSNREDIPAPLESVLDQVVTSGETLRVDWFTGILVLPHGKLVDYVHMGYGSTYSDYLLLEVKEGKLTGRRAFNAQQYQEFKEKQFHAFKKTEAYKREEAELKAKGQSQEHIDYFLRNFIVDYSSQFLDAEDSTAPQAQSLGHPPQGP